MIVNGLVRKEAYAIPQKDLINTLVSITKEYLITGCPKDKHYIEYIDDLLIQIERQEVIQRIKLSKHN